MVSQTKKLLAAGFVLAIGLGLAWPFRRTEPLRRHAPAQTLSPSVAAKTIVAKTERERHAALKPLPVQPAGNLPAVTTPASKSGFAMAATQASIEPTPEVAEPGPPVFAPVAEAAAADHGDGAPSLAEERVHVVHDGDSLERLAGRYLGDEGRALEIFDLNRDVLSNPHWLPIGAEIRIPSRAESPVE